MEELHLAGDPGSTIASSILFDIRACEPVDGQVCKSIPEIETFIQDIQVDNWIIYKMMNFTDRLAEPTFLVQDIIDS